MTVFGAVQLAEACKRRGKPSSVEHALGERDTQLIALADIAQIAGAVEFSIFRRRI